MLKFSAHVLVFEHEYQWCNISVFSHYLHHITLEPSLVLYLQFHVSLLYVFFSLPTPFSFISSCLDPSSLSCSDFQRIRLLPLTLTLHFAPPPPTFLLASFHPVLFFVSPPSETFECCLSLHHQPVSSPLLSSFSLPSVVTVLFYSFFLLHIMIVCLTNTLSIYFYQSVSTVYLFTYISTCLTIHYSISFSSSNT